MNIEIGQLESIVFGSPFGSPSLDHTAEIEKKVSETGTKSLNFFAEAWKAFCAFFASLFSSFKAQKGGVNAETEAKVTAVIEESCLAPITSMFEDAKEALKGYVTRLIQEQEARTPSFEEARYKLEKKSGVLLKGQQKLAQKECFHDAQKALKGFGYQLLKGQSERGQAYIKAEIKKAEKNLKKAVIKTAAEYVYTTVEEMQARYQSALIRAPELERLQLFTRSQIALYKIQLRYLGETTLAAKAERTAIKAKESAQTFARRATKFLKTGGRETTAPKTKEATPAEKRTQALKALGKQTRKQIKELGIEDGKVLMERLAQLAQSLHNMTGLTESGDLRIRTKASIEKQLASTDQKYITIQKELAVVRGDLAFAKFSAKDSRGNINVPLSVQSSFGRLRSELKILKVQDKKLAESLKIKTVTDITLPASKKRKAINELITDQFVAQVRLEQLKK